MARQLCPVCNETKLGFLNSENIKDGKICANCESKLNLIHGTQGNGKYLNELTVSEAQEMIRDGKIFNDPKIKKDKEQQDKKREAEPTPEMKKIINELEEAGVSYLFGTSKELNSLPNVLDEEEKIIYAVSGMMASSGFLGKHNFADTVLAVITNKRFLVINNNLLYGSDFTEIPFDKINGVNYSTKLIFAEIRVDNGMKTTEILNVNKDFAPIFVKKLKAATSNHETEPMTKTSIADELLKYKELFDSGLLTQEEFDDQKRKLLNK